MSAAVRIQIMLLARKNHFGKKPDLADQASHREQPTARNDWSRLNGPDASLLGPGGIASSETEVTND